MRTDERILWQNKLLLRGKYWKFSLSMVLLTSFYFLLPLVSSYNLDTNFLQIYEDPQAASSLRATYFGYSVLLYSDSSTSWVQISAPRANDSLHRDILEPGLIYRCNVGKPCSSFIFERTGNVKKKNYHDRKDQQWLGGTMAIHKEQDLMAVCAPRWIDEKESDERLIEGVCYTAPASYNNYTAGQSYKNLPLNEKEYKIFKYKTSKKDTYVYDYGLGQAGMSAYFLKDKISERAELILGAPGIHNWQGSVVLLKYYHLNTGIKDDKIIPTRESDLKEAPYFGYSVAAGKFFSNESVYVASAPRWNNRGFVTVFRVPSKTKNNLKVIQRIDYNGNEIGGYFGAFLEIGDLNNDGYDDLLVSAPMLRIPTVFIYNGGERNSLLAPKTGLSKLQGGSLFEGNSRFGLSITAIDLDLDTYKEVLVGAPFAEDGHGAVALWKGGSKGLQGSGAPATVYRATDLYPYLRGFGISIAPPVDIDQNLHPDVAIGSFLSGHAVIFRGRPVIKIEISINRTSIGKLLRDSTNLTIPYCFKFDSSIVLAINISIDMTISIDKNFKRAFLKGQPQTNQIFHIGKIINTAEPSCDEFHILLKKKIENFLDPLDVLINTTLINYVKKNNVVLISTDKQGQDDFNKMYPIADPAYNHLLIPFETDCGSNDVCETDLNVNIEIKGLTNKFIVGSSNSIQLNITVGNTGEPSYVTQIRLSLPSYTALDRLITVCDNENNNVVICKVANPLKSNQSKSIILEIDMHDVLMAQQGQYLIFTVDALTQSNEIKPENNKQTFKLFLDVEASVEIIGKSSQDEFSYEEIDDKVSRELVKFSHLYEIQKFGASPVEEVTLTIKTPYAYKTKKQTLNFVKIYKPEGYQDGQKFTCDENELFEEINSVTNEKYDQDFIPDKVINRKRRHLNEFYIDKKQYIVPPLITNKKIFEKKQEIPKRNKRSFNIPKNKTHSLILNLPKNRTIEINCGQENVLCTEITCHVGPFRRSQIVSRLLITMMADISTIKSPIMGAKDILVITTQGTATILDITLNAVAVTNVSSIFVSSLPGLKVALWLIILCVVLGLLLLLLLICVLTKAGFFNRKKKDELEALKKAEETEKIEIDSDWHEESLPCEDTNFEIDNDYNKI